MSNKVSTFQERLNRAMNEKGIRAVDLSAASGVSESMLSCYRSGRYEATQVNLQKLAEALNVSIAWLMGYDVQMGVYEFNDPQNKTELILSKLERLTAAQLAIVENLIDEFLT